MLHYFFNFIYVILLIIFFPHLLVACLFKGKYREGFCEKFLGSVPQRKSFEHPLVWIHAVSVGEVNLVASILKEFERRYPEFEFVISSTSQMGLELAQKKFANKTVFYAPLDFSWAIRRAFRNLQPDYLVLIELELWPNMLLTAQKQHVPVIVMNGRLGEKSFKNYSRFRCVFRRIFRTITFVTTQDADSATRFASLGVPAECVKNVGSIKYDGAQFDRQNEKTRHLANLWHIKPSDRIFLAGSTQAPEEAMALDVFRKLAPTHPELRLILVPRHAERFTDVAKMLEKSEFTFQKRSELSDDTTQNQRESILLVDTIGELGGWWGTSHIGFVGGSMGTRGGQNMLEPAAFGTAVSFGPNTWNFRDIVQNLLKNNAAVVVHNTSEMTEFVRRCLDTPEYASSLGQRASDFVASQQGALQKTLDEFDRLQARG